MGTAAAASGDVVVGSCPAHLIPGPVGDPVKAPPMPFSAPMTLGVVPSVLLMGRPAVVVGSTGLNTPPHVGLHAADPFFVPATQIGQVTVGSPTVLVGGRPLGRTGSIGTLCASPGSLMGTAATVLVA